MTPSSARVGLPKTYLRPCLLLLLSEGPSHGYELLDAVRDLEMPSAEAGGLYRSLRAMDEEALVRSWWEPSESGPARRTYAITRSGKRALARHMAEVDRVSSLLTDLVARYRLSADRT